MLTAVSAPRFRVFLLSPANCSGKRAQLLSNLGTEHHLGLELRRETGAPIGAVFSFVSSLYFRGKLAYARAFARPPQGIAGVYVITPCDGLKDPEAPLRIGDLMRYAAVPVDPNEPRYSGPLQRDLEALAPVCAQAEVVLLGSVASAKYADLLTSVLGERVHFPADFVGRGDMSRGGLLLRCVEEKRELRYVPLFGSARHGARPTRLPPRKSPGSRFGADSA